MNHTIVMVVILIQRGLDFHFFFSATSNPQSHFGEFENLSDKTESDSLKVIVNGDFLPHL